ncbi:hypothetical protein CHS0354_037563 [Potamilus streckersoni]|uniref:Presequence protease, mitochondrial n=1 Tax=Potamilus streckersoni TaxID=2493646 RepID=A0AAE0VW76_9BIVA|nr:hypothetical protein CHS0354_037563 [Potamilus streckersoni]
MASSCGNFECQYSVKGDGDIPIVKYKSTKTGLTVFIADVEGPIVNGYICLATEAHDDDGLPHTLEHLVFMGSEDFPYKGVLDLLANRCLASGTNAWTDTDHTCYTMTNAGSEGFLNLLPVYLEHILYPTLTESAYITEVHHVNEEGEDAGVVYCEMQARENTDESRCHLEMVRNMYPGHCGYKSETGGIMKNLRESTSHAKVCSYHKAFYRPDNLSIIITGHVEPDKVFAALQSLEEKIISKGPLPLFSRPWQSEVPPLEASVMKTVPYPSDNESHGMVKVAWRGPKAKDQYKLTSLFVLYDYLHDSPISPLQRDFVELEDPYCSKVHCSMMENSECCIFISFQNIIKEKLSQIYPRLTDILNKLATGQEKIDMTRMYNVIHRKVLERLSSVEDHPHEIVAHNLIGDFLFGDTKEDLETRTSVISILKDLKSKPEEFWVALINQYFINKPNVVIIGEPSKALMEEIGKTEAERVAKQQNDLGKDGLKKMGEILEKATEENEQEPLDSIITDISVPNVSQIYFHPIIPYSNHSRDAANRNPKFPLADIPFQFHLDDIHTNFVQISALLDSNGVSQELKYYLPIFCEVLFESPVVRNGVLISHEEVIQQLHADTLVTEANLGIDGEKFYCGYIPQVVQVLLKVEKEKYEKGVTWLKDLLYNIKFTAERLRIVAKRMSNDIAEYKNKGYTVVRTLLKSIIFSSECNHVISSMLKQETFLEQILQQLDKEPEVVESRMNQLLQVLTRPSNLTIHMSADTSRLEAEHPLPHRVWTDFNHKKDQFPPDRCTMKKTSEFVLSMESSPEKQIIVGVGSVESSYLVQVVPCIDSYSHPDYPAIMVFIQYLTQLEGPMWRQIRGLGLSYHYSMYVQPESGLLYFLLAKSTHIVNAFKEARDIVSGYAKGETEFGEIELESAKSSLTFEVIEKEKTVSEASKECLLSYYRGVSHTYNRDLLQKITKVSIADLQRVGEKYMAPLFDVSQIRCALCCHPSKVEEITGDFRKLSIELKILKSLEEDFLCRL